MENPVARARGETRAKPFSLTVPAPAKLNLFLHVTGRRSDGYHLLESLMVLIDVADTITVELRDDGAIERTDPIPGVPQESDLAFRAAKLLKDHTGISLGASISLVKRIPIGAGLGGGSSDAASVLLALNRLWRLDLSRTELMGLGLKLGADVPFFVFGNNAHVSGIGEVMQPVTVPRMDVLLAVPLVNVSTAEIFSAPGLIRNGDPARAHAFAAGSGRNDLQPVAQQRYRAITDAMTRLQRVNAVAPRGWADNGVRMSGSGSAVFRIVAPVAPAASTASTATTAPAADRSDCADPGDHSAAAGSDGIRVIRTRFLTRHPLREFVAK